MLRQPTRVTSHSLSDAASEVNGSDIPRSTIFSIFLVRKGQASLAEIAAANLGISVRSARRMERATGLSSYKPHRFWRSRPDPFGDVWERKYDPMLPNAPQGHARSFARVRPPKAKARAAAHECSVKHLQWHAGSFACVTPRLTCCRVACRVGSGNFEPYPAAFRTGLKDCWLRFR